MSVRETLNKNPRIATGATAVILLLAVIFIIMQLIGPRNNIPTKAYFTIDDGANYFADDIGKLAPFEKEGKQAFRVQVFRCGKSGKPFIAYIERYTPEAKAKLEEMRTKGPQSAPPGPMDMTVLNGVEVKKPGDKSWVKQSDFQKSQAIMMPKCPDGSTQDLQPVLP